MDTATKSFERLVGGAAGAAPSPSAEAEAWSTAVFTTLGRLLGQAKADGIALRFQADLQARFADLENRETLVTDAHTVTSTAGMLGFMSLSAAARAFESAVLRGDDVASRLADLLQCRQTAGDLLAQHFRPH